MVENPGISEVQQNLMNISNANSQNIQDQACRETFDSVAQLLSHTQVHKENKYKCDECDWHFSLIAGLTLHGKDCHDTRHHACSWCVEYFDNVDALYAHTRNRHHFECMICFNVSPTAEELEEHIKEKHGGFQPSEQEIQAQRRGEERLERKERKKQKAEAEARRTMSYVLCLGWSNGLEAQFATKSIGGSVGTSSRPSGRKTVSVSFPMYSLSLGHRIL